MTSLYREGNGERRCNLTRNAEGHRMKIMKVAFLIFYDPGCDVAVMDNSFSRDKVSTKTGQLQ